MTSEIYIENFRVDINKDISSLLNFALDDVKDFSSRSTTWSKTIILPGTNNNNRIFGHIYQFGQSNTTSDSGPNIGTNFNASKSADCIIFQDQMQTFSGVMRLMAINNIAGKTEYEVSVFGKMAALNSALSGGMLDQLDFSSYDHDWTYANIINSWDNTPGSGYYYPLIDYGTYSTGKHDWDQRTFRPALYAREYIDKMFAAAGFRWSSDLFNTSRFKSLIIPSNQKKLYRLATSFINGSNAVPYRSTGSENFLINSTSDPDSNLSFNDAKFNSLDIASNFTNLLSQNFSFQYNQPTTISVKIKYRFKGVYSSTGGTTYVAIGVSKNIASIPTYTSADFLNYQLVAPVPGSSVPFDFYGEFTTTLLENDYLQLTGLYFGGPPLLDSVLSLDEAYLIVDGLNATVVEASIGDAIKMSDVIPKNIRQVDFLLSIVKLFNLYVYEDKFDPSLIHLKPYVDFYGEDGSDSIDWTYKLNRDKNIRNTPMSEINSKKYKFKFKQDSDYYNDLYRKRYNEGYGDYTFDTSFEFSEQEKSFELIFSSTPLVGYIGEEKVYSTIFKRTGSDSSPVEENTDSNIRILQSKKIIGVSSWEIKDGASTLTTSTNYGYAGHLNDPDAPSSDINFGVPYELFFTLVSGDLSVNQFNLYWLSYMLEITDKDSKMLTANFVLKPIDIYNLDFSKFVNIDGVLFRLNKISDYNATRPSDCKCELLKVNYLIY